MRLLLAVLPLLVGLCLSKPLQSLKQYTKITISIENDGDSADQGNQTFFTNVVQDPERAGLKYDSSSKSWTGYIDVPSPTPNNPLAAKHFFFWLQLSKNKPEKDPVMLWLNGGPGASSMYGLLSQWGSKTIVGENGKFKENEAALNEKVTILYLDQPGGIYSRPPVPTNSVGYTYFDQGIPDTVTAETAADDVLSFLNGFRAQQFDKWRWQGQPFHIAGESYAGHYIPAITRRILRVPTPNWVQDFKSIVIGNPWMDAFYQQPNNYVMVCDDAPGTLAAYRLPAATCANWRNSIQGCQNAIETCRTTPATCAQVSPACNTISADQYSQLTNRDYYDISILTTSPAPGDPINRDDQERWMTDWMRDDNTREALGITASEAPRISWQMINWSLNRAWHASGQWWRNARLDMDSILTTNNPIKVLIYAGDLDFICNWVGVKEVTKRIEWPGRAGFNEAALLGANGEERYNRLLGSGGRQYGSYFSYDRLTFARVYGAGHMINERQPANAKKMFYDWITNGALTGPAPRAAAAETGGDADAVGVDAKESGVERCGHLSTHEKEGKESCSAGNVEGSQRQKILVEEL